MEFLERDLCAYPYQDRNVKTIDKYKQFTLSHSFMKFDKQQCPEDVDRPVNDHPMRL